MAVLSHVAGGPEWAVWTTLESYKVSQLLLQANSVLTGIGYRLFVLELEKKSNWMLCWSVYKSSCPRELLIFVTKEPGQDNLVCDH